MIFPPILTCKMCGATAACNSCIALLPQTSAPAALRSLPFHHSGAENCWQTQRFPVSVTYAHLSLSLLTSVLLKSLLPDYLLQFSISLPQVGSLSSKLPCSISFVSQQVWHWGVWGISGITRINCAPFYTNEGACAHAPNPTVHLPHLWSSSILWDAWSLAPIAAVQPLLAMLGYDHLSVGPQTWVIETGVDMLILLWLIIVIRHQLIMNGKYSIVMMQ